MYRIDLKLSAFVICCFSILLTGFSAKGQIIYTDGFTELLKEAHFDFFEPVEQWLHVTPKVKDQYMAYDLVLQNDRNDLELRYDIRPFTNQQLDFLPKVENVRLIHHIASNNPEEEILVKVLDSETLKRRFNADWGACHFFTPKESYTEKRRGALLSIYGEGKALANIVILYNDWDFDPLESFNQLRFRE